MAITPSTLLILGASGDLTGRLLLPAIGTLMSSKEGPATLTLVGAGSDDWSQDTWLARVKESFAAGGAKGDRVDAMLKSTKYLKADVTSVPDLQKLIDACDGAPAIYFALPPAVTALACQALAQVSLPEGTALVLEKPFGTDEASAAALNKSITNLVPENQIHRVDHFLGKSTVTNLLGLRFANRLFEPLWSADHIERVDIVFDEVLGLENRARYYDKAGALVDMIQSHLLQVMALVAMDPPASINAEDLRGRKADALRATRIWKNDPVEASPPCGVHVRNDRRPPATRLHVRGRGRPVATDRDTGRVDPRGGQLAVGGCALPAALGEGAGREAAGGGDHLQAGAPRRDGTLRPRRTRPACASPSAPTSCSWTST